MSHIFQPVARRTNAFAVAALLIAVAAVVWAVAFAGGRDPAQAAPSTAPNSQLAPNGGLVAFAQFTVNGEVLDSGQQVISSMGGDDVVDWSIVDLVTLSAAADADRLSSRVSMSPITITKRLDKTSPLLLRAMRQNQVVEVTVHLYWNAVDGSTERAYTYEVEQGRIVGVRHSATSPGIPGSEVIAVSPRIIRVIDEINSVEDSWDLLADSGA